MKFDPPIRVDLTDYVVVGYRVPELGESFVNKLGTQIIDKAGRSHIPVQDRSPRWIVRRDGSSFVQVKTGPYSRLTYNDPSGTLDVDDNVIVPLGSYDRESLGTVVALGRGSYTGPTKDVIARLTREELIAA